MGGKGLDGLTIAHIARIGLDLLAHGLQLFDGSFELGDRTARKDDVDILFEEFCNGKAHSRATAGNNAYVLHMKLQYNQLTRAGDASSLAASPA